MRYIKVSVSPGFYGDRSQTSSQYVTWLVVDTGIDGGNGEALAKCVTSADADALLAALNV